MSLDNLDSPLRITWDLCPWGTAVLDQTELLKVSERLVDAGIFSIMLDEQPLLHPGLSDALKQMSAEGCQLSLVLGDNEAELTRLESLESKHSLFVDAGFWLDKPKGIEALDSYLQKLTASGYSPSLLWVPVSGQIHSLFPLFNLCKTLNIPRLKLPNHKISFQPDLSETDRLLHPHDLETLAQLVREQPLDAGDTALEVHDLFLWELIFPQGGGARTEYGGCQAGNSLGHIAANADVWPCSSWPQVLGNLLSNDLLTIWDSAGRHEVRAEVGQPPEDCAGCRDYAICFGGCRGLARSCRKDDGQRDILCHGPRK